MKAESNGTSRASIILTTLLTAMVTASFWMLAWTARTVAGHAEALAEHGVKFTANDEHWRLHDSDAEKMARRTERLEDAMSSIKAIDARLNEMQRLQIRIEQALLNKIEPKP